jgi:hypothetical protein
MRNATSDTPTRKLSDCASACLCEVLLVEHQSTEARAA